MGGLIEVAVKTDGLTRDAVADVCRRVLRLVEPEVEVFETDLPMTDPDWTDEVVSAARRLGAHARRGWRPDSYSATGMVPASDRDDWEALVVLAPHAYDVGVWSEAGEKVVSLHDAGGAVVLRLSPDQLAELKTSLGVDRVVATGRRGWRRGREHHDDSA